uniref:Large ribosomal subunit protein uL4m n=1 Tax=Cairina moschata TaxID=8855 RepID=A0A8C3CD74_CAIMO
IGDRVSLPSPPPPPLSPPPPPLSPPAPLSPLSPSRSPLLRACGVPVVSGSVAAQAWVGSLRHPQHQRLGLAELHPDVFAIAPRLDILHAVATWQKNFKRIVSGAVGSGGRIWGERGRFWGRSPLGSGGGIAHGPRGPTSYYYLLPMKVRVLGLKAALTVKLMQDQLHVVDNLEMPTADPRYLQDLARYRHWGSSVLIVDV